MPPFLKFHQFFEIDEQICFYYQCKLHINRMNSIFNIEKRSLKSEMFKYYVLYMFCSRVQNTQMKKNLSLMKNYHLVIIQSFIWDLTRYNDSDGQDYMKNLNFFLNNFRNRTFMYRRPFFSSCQNESKTKFFLYRINV